jgi:predicted DNA-binding transcriptional regulator YafY
MSRAENKAERLLQMEALLLANPQGLTQAEMARRLGVDRSVIHRNLYDFQKIYPTIVHDDGRISLDRSAYVVKVAFTLHEATAVHLAARLMATRMDKHNPHAASALRKLGVALEKLAPRISAHVKQSADVMDEADQRQDPRYLDVLEKLTLAWAEQRKVRVWHRKHPKEPVQEHIFQVYFIEPYAVGQSIHAIGFSETRNAQRTMKLERIERVEVLKDTYKIPDDFDPRKFLADAWGIWYTETEPVEVVLKFHPRVAYRVQESRWHRSEQPLEELENGYVIWRAKIAEPKEMLNWIRGWGSDVEVLAPESLREVCKEEAQKLIEIYRTGKGE